MGGVRCLGQSPKKKTVIFFDTFPKSGNIALTGGFCSNKVKYGPKKVRRHLERSHINSKMCSVISEGNRTRIQPVIKLFGNFAHFVTRYLPPHPFKSCNSRSISTQHFKSILDLTNKFHSLNSSILVAHSLLLN